MRLHHFNNPYVDFVFENFDFRIGLRLLSLNIESLRANHDVKGGQRAVTMLVQSNLVLTDDRSIPSIEEVNIHFLITSGKTNP